MQSSHLARVAAGLLTLLSGCAALELRAQQLDDGTLQLECPGEVADCVRRAESYCGERPILVYGAGTRAGPRGHGGQATGSIVAQVHFTCTLDRRVPLPMLRPKHAPPPPCTSVPASPSESAPAPAVAAPSVCAPGATQACVGPGACAGGQRCLADGTGFSACECAAR